MPTREQSYVGIKPIYISVSAGGKCSVHILLLQLKLLAQIKLKWEACPPSLLGQGLCNSDKNPGRFSLSSLQLSKETALTTHSTGQGHSSWAQRKMLCQSHP